MHDDQLLTLSHIAKASIEMTAEFAFLSACQSATGSKLLPDEVVHLAAGFQFVGFRGVIGTLWSVGDEDALHIAEQIYSQLFKDGVRAAASDAALALNQAVRYLRDEQQIPFVRLIPFVHFGF
jgi:CHAT domain-containing protein